MVKYVCKACFVQKLLSNVKTFVKPFRIKLLIDPVSKKRNFAVHAWNVFPAASDALENHNFDKTWSQTLN
jgi:hypothetical protein